MLMPYEEFVQLMVDRGFGYSFTDHDGKLQLELEYLMVLAHEDHYELFVTQTAGDTYLIKKLTQSLNDIDGVVINQTPAEPFTLEDEWTL